MIFEEITLYNFGIYKGKHTIVLDSPSPNKPIILIGALNGAGKTTFLDALQLALYGKFAKCSNRGRLSYSTYLEKNINTFADEKVAGITVRFRHGDNTNKPQLYEVSRYWSKDKQKECKESVKVYFNGQYDSLLSDNWEEFVNEFIPQSIAELFFFDGEKIENLADPKRSAELLKTGVEALLGLELLSTLHFDLNELKRKKQEKLVSVGDIEQLAVLKNELSKVIEQKKHCIDELKIANEEKINHEESYSSFKQKMLRSGAEKIDQKEQLEVEKITLSQRLFSLKQDIMKVLSSSLPLMLVTELLEKARQQAKIEKNNFIFKDAQKLLDEQKAIILNVMKDSLSSDMIQKIEEAIVHNHNCAFNQNFKAYLHCDPAVFEGINEKIDNERNIIKDMLQQKNEIEESIILVERKINTIPSLDSVKEIIAENAIMQDKLSSINERESLLRLKLAELDNEQKNLEAKYNLVLVKKNAEDFEQQRQNNIISHIETLKEIVFSFNKDLVQENIYKLERKIKAKFDQLKRKDTLIGKINIDPNDYSLTLYSTNFDKLSSDRLSAGERQLLSIAILWGLADSSGKELPTIIDTPMGRLDGEHRTRLIEKYLPNAASQVILLSTDEEIYGEYYKKLKPYIAQEYNIHYDEEKRSSFFKSGYFEAL
ncbi:DNA sulfur modification protein DndD [Enterobacter ludwigii]|uniref:DNA sulfur modification protein DndD n=1 Tax=Enterobacter ludwigii TaxID=299767 RepID=UPI0039755573